MPDGMSSEMASLRLALLMDSQRSRCNHGVTKGSEGTPFIVKGMSPCVHVSVGLLYSTHRDYYY
jgi:hypothetical protein